MLLLLAVHCTDSSWLHREIWIWSSRVQRFPCFKFNQFYLAPGRISQGSVWAKEYTKFNNNKKKSHVNSLKKLLLEMLQCQFLMWSIFQFQCDTPCTNSSMTMAKNYLQGDSSFNSSKKKKNWKQNLANRIWCGFSLIISNISLLLARINNSHNNRYPDESSSRDGPEFGSLAGKRTRKWVIFSKHLHFWDKRGGV